MSTNVITVTPETTVMKALDLMKEHDIHRLPVVEDGKLVGLLTEELVAGHSPSMATSLSMHELNYLLNKTTGERNYAKASLNSEGSYIIRRSSILLCVSKCWRLASRRVRGHVEGTITDKDIFDAFIEISGYNTPGSRLFIEINEDKPGPLEEISNVLRENSERFDDFCISPRWESASGASCGPDWSSMKWRTLSHKRLSRDFSDEKITSTSPRITPQYWITEAPGQVYVLAPTEFSNCHSRNKF